jgi:hypothetical protein
MSGPSVVCFGVCKGVAGWHDPDTGLCCTVCAGSGVYSPPSSGYAKVEEKARLTHSAIVAGDSASPTSKRRFFRRPRRPRMNKAKRMAMARQAQRRKDAEALAEFERTRPEGWREQLDQLKNENAGLFARGKRS